MKKHVLMPVLAKSAVTLVLPETADDALGLVLTEDGTLGIAGAVPSGATLLAELKPLTQAGDTAWWLSSRSTELLLNGATPLPLAALSPGDLMAVGDRWWFVTTEWRPESMTAPPELAERPCPVCGGALNLAPVCRCACGRYSHLEQPGADDDKELLNCFLAAACAVCGREPSLEAQLIPEPPEKLLAPN